MVGNERELITQFAKQLIYFLEKRQDVSLESVDHATPEMPFDLGTARDNIVIHNRNGDRIFITELTGIAYIRTRLKGAKYKLRVGSISLPFEKIYLTNTAQAGKTLSLIIGYGAFVNFDESNRNVLATIAGKDFATQATLTLIKAKTDNLTDLASQTTLALIKAKTDKLNVNLSTVATQATLALMKTKIDSVFTEVQKLSTNVSILDTSTGSALTVSLEVGQRSFVEVFMKTSAVATFKLYGSRDNVNWRQADEVEFDGAGELKNGYWNADRYIKVSVADANNNEIELTAS